MIRTALASGLVLAGLVTAAAQPAPTSATPPKTLGLLAATFAVSDLDRSIAFYADGLGLTAAARMDNPSYTEVPLLFPAGGPPLMLLKPKSAAASASRIGRIVLDVPDLRALEARLNAAGYALAQPVVENLQHHVLVALIKDPDGNELELVQRPR